MALDFPGSPTNGQSYNSGNTTYKYSSASNTWLVVSPYIGLNANSSDHQILYNDAGDLKGTGGLLYFKSSDLVTANTLTVANTITATGNITASHYFGDGENLTNVGIPIFARSNAAFAKLNVAYEQANTARSHANVGYGQANTTRDLANTIRTHANTAHESANAALIQANTARVHANTAHESANAGLIQANTARVQANDAFTRANDSLAQANSVFHNANTKFLANANVGFANNFAYTGNLYVTTGNLIVGRFGVSDVGNGVRLDVGGSINAATHLVTQNLAFDAAGWAGLKSPSANIVAVFNTRTEKARFDASGNLIIGKTDSNQTNGVKLDVVGAINASSYFATQNLTFDTISSAVIKAPAANVISFSTSQAERLRIDSSGNLIIGRTDSNQINGVKLDVVGAVNASALFVTGWINAASINTSSNINNFGLATFMRSNGDMVITANLIML